jgi:hypothetical protein
MQGSAGAGLGQVMALGNPGTYKALVFRQEDSDTGVDLSDCEGDEHGV